MSIQKSFKIGSNIFPNQVHNKTPQTLCLKLHIKEGKWEDNQQSQDLESEAQDWEPEDLELHPSVCRTQD